MQKSEFVSPARHHQAGNGWISVQAANDDRVAAQNPAQEQSAECAGLSQGFIHALDWLSYGVLILDRQARVLFANKTAQRLIKSARLSLSQGTLRPRSGKQNDALRGTLSQASLAGEEEALKTFELGDPPLQCTLAPIASAAKQDMPGPAGILFVADPNWMRAPTATDLHAKLGLTMAEATLAAELAQGNRLLACARRLGIAASTARTHLHRIFDKTGTRRQAELVRLILTTTPALRRIESGAGRREAFAAPLHAVQAVR